MASGSCWLSRRQRVAARPERLPRGGFARSFSRAGGGLAALLFAVHPMQVESVAWITELKKVLSGFFCLSAFLVFLHFRQSVEHRRLLYSLSFLLFLCALLSKTSTVVLPGAILLVLWWKRERVRRQDWWPLIPFFLVGAALALLTVWVEKNTGRAGI